MPTRHISRSTVALLVAVATLCLIHTATSFADALSVFPPPETRVRAGSEVTLPVSITGAQDLGALQFELLYDEEILEVVNVTQGSGMPPVLLDFNVVQPGLLRVALAGSEPIDGDTRIEVRFRGLAAGAGAIELQEVKAWALTTGYDLLIEARPGQVTVTTGLPVSGILITVILLLILIAVILLLMRMRKSKVSGSSHQSTVPPQSNEKLQTPPTSKSFCRNCGQQLSPSTSFCGKCGEKI
jgi:ribosomal protein L40E